MKALKNNRLASGTAVASVDIDYSHALFGSVNNEKTLHCRDLMDTGGRGLKALSR